MELHSHKEGVILDFNRFNDVSVGGRAAYHKSAVFKIGKEIVVELVSVTMAFFNQAFAVCLTYDGAVFKMAGICPEAHRTAYALAFFVGHNVDDGMLGVSKLSACWRP